GASRSGARGQPAVPDLVHACVVSQIAQMDQRRKQMRPVCAGFGQKPVDMGQRFASLLADIAGKIISQLARQINGALVDHYVAVTKLGMQALDSHRHSPGYEWQRATLTGDPLPARVKPAGSTCSSAPRRSHRSG